MNRHFENVSSLMSHFRGSGTSTLIKKISDEEDVIVVTGTLESGKQFGGKSVLLSNLNEGIKGHKPKPILFDNHTIMILCEDYHRTVNHYEILLGIENDKRNRYELEKIIAKSETTRAKYKLERMQMRNLWQRIINKKI